MFRTTRLLAIALIANLLLGASALKAAEWQVVKVTGTVWVVAAGMQPVHAAAGMTLPPNATVATASRARAMLRHGEDILSIGPSTHVAPQSRRVEGLTTVLMRQGEVEADVERRGRPRFAVQTPFLAAVVKGTRFIVTVSATGAEVSVNTGRVEVTALGGGQAVELTNGQSATAGAGGGLRVSGAGALPQVQAVSPKSALVETPAGLSANNANAERGGRNAAGNSNAGGNIGNSNAGGNSGNSNAGGNSGNSNAGGNSGNSNAGGNGGNSNAGGNRN